MAKERQFPVTDEVRVLRYMRIEKGLSLKKAGRLEVTHITHREGNFAKVAANDKIEEQSNDELQVRLLLSI